MIKRRLTLSFFFGILILILIPQLLSPLSQLDGSWYFSQAVSISNGSYFYNHFTNTTMPLLYGWVQADIAILAPNQLGIKLFYWIGLALFGTILILTKKLSYSSIAVLAAVIMDHSFRLHRPEPILIFIGIILYLYLNGKNYRLMWIAVPSVALVLLHPVNGVLLLLSILVYNNMFAKVTKRMVVIGALLAIGAIGFGLLFPEHIYTTTLKMRLSSIGLQPILKFLMYSGFTVLLMLVLANDFWSKGRVIGMIGLSILCIVLGGYYYFLFLLVPFILHFIEKENELKYQWLVIGLLIGSFLINVIHPYISFIENPAYNANAYEIKKELQHLEFTDQLSIENQFAPVVYDNPEVKLLLINEHQTVVVDTLESGDVLALTNTSDLMHCRSYLKANHVDMEYEIEEVVKPCKGNLSLQSFYQKRTNDLGLWYVHL